MWKAQKLDLTDGTTTILPTSAIVKGVYINTTMSAHACTINNGGNVLLIIPASAAAGSVFNFAGELGVLFDASLIVAPNISATGSITIFYENRT